MPSGDDFTFGPYRLDGRSRRLLRDDVAVPIQPRQFQLLQHFVERAGDLLTKNQLIEAVWKGTAVTDASLTQAIFHVRNILDPEDPARYIETAARVGYRFIAPISRVSARRTEDDLDALLATHRAFLDGRAALETLEAAQLGRARATFEHVVAIDPSDAGFHLGLANACVLQYETTRTDPSPNTDALHLAVTHAREACELSPGNAEAWATFGFVLERVGEREKALAAHRRATTIDPRNWLHQLRLAYASWGEERIVAARRVLVQVPRQPLACVLIATVVVARGALAEAEQALEPGLAEMARSGDAPARFSAVALYWLKGLLCLARGDDEGAKAAFERELALEARGHLYARECCANTCCALGALALRQGDRAGARLWFEQAMTRVPQHLLARVGLWMSGEGERVAVPVSEDTGNPVDRAVARAACLVFQGDHAGAAELVATALSVAPSGSAGWRVLVEPLLGVHRAPDAWSRVLAQMRNRAM